MPADFINSVQTPETRKAKYRLALSLGATVPQANQMRDWRVTNIYRHLSLPVPCLKERKKILKQFGGNVYLKPAAANNGA